MNVPEVGDYVSQRQWHGEYYRVAHVDHATGVLFLDYLDAGNRPNRMEYPIRNDWIFKQKIVSRKRAGMEDTREYLDALEKVYDRYFGL